MSYLALYRKYRPKSFNEVIGQDAVVQTLRNQVIGGRIAHAYLFSGPRGTGKTTIAKILAQAVNCEHNDQGSPCHQCPVCQCTEGTLNTDIVEIDAASNNGVDNIRDLIEESRYAPQHGKYKVYIIDEVHMLSNSAFNALLKILEEPSSHIVFILATTELHKVPPTIGSRCQKFQFKLMTNEQLMDSMKSILSQEGREADDDALMHIAKTARGGMRDCISLLDQCISFNTSITLETVKDVLGELTDESVESLAGYISKGDVQSALDVLHNEIQNGKDVRSASIALYEYFKQEYFRNPNIDQMVYQRYMSILAELSEKLKFNSNGVILFEIEIIKMCKPQMEANMESLHHRIVQLESLIERLLESGIPVSDVSVTQEVRKQPDKVGDTVFITYRVPDKIIRTEVSYVC